jgi:hypothetical protein
MVARYADCESVLRSIEFGEDFVNSMRARQITVVTLAVERLLNATPPGSCSSVVSATMTAAT